MAETVVPPATLISVDLGDLTQAVAGREASGAAGAAEPKWTVVDADVAEIEAHSQIESVVAILGNSAGECFLVVAQNALASTTLLESQRLFSDKVTALWKLTFNARRFVAIGFASTTLLLDISDDEWVDCSDMLPAADALSRFVGTCSLEGNQQSLVQVCQHDVFVTDPKTPTKILEWAPERTPQHSRPIISAAAYLSPRHVLVAVDCANSSGSRIFACQTADSGVLRVDELTSVPGGVSCLAATITSVAVETRCCRAILAVATYDHNLVVSAVSTCVGPCTSCSSCSIIRNLGVVSLGDSLAHSMVFFCDPSSIRTFLVVGTRNGTCLTFLFHDSCTSADEIFVLRDARRMGEGPVDVSLIDSDAHPALHELLVVCEPRVWIGQISHCLGDDTRDIKMTMLGRSDHDARYAIAFYEHSGDAVRCVIATTEDALGALETCPLEHCDLTSRAICNLPPTSHRVICDGSNVAVLCEAAIVFVDIPSSCIFQTISVRPPSITDDASLPVATACIWRTGDGWSLLACSNGAAIKFYRRCDLDSKKNVDGVCKVRQWLDFGIWHLPIQTPLETHNSAPSVLLHNADNVNTISALAVDTEHCCTEIFVGCSRSFWVLKIDVEPGLAVPACRVIATTNCAASVEVIHPSVPYIVASLDDGSVMMWWYDKGVLRKGARYRSANSVKITKQIEPRTGTVFAASLNGLSLLSLRASSSASTIKALKEIEWPPPNTAQMHGLRLDYIPIFATPVIRLPRFLVWMTLRSDSRPNLVSFLPNGKIVAHVQLTYSDSEIIQRLLKAPEDHHFELSKLNSMKGDAPPLVELHQILHLANDLL